MTSEQLAISAISLFAQYAGQDLARWQALVGERVVHKTLEAGEVVEVALGGGGKPTIVVAFPGDDRDSRRFTEEILANQAFFPEVIIPLDAATIEALRQDLLEVSRRAAEQEAARRQRAEEQQRLRTISASRRSAPAARLVDNSLLEVLSVPAGRTLGYVLAHHVHAHPDSYPYRQTPYITFRAGDGGEMSLAYDLGQPHFFLLNPDAPAALRERIIASQPIAEEAKERVRHYHAERQRGRQFRNDENEDYRFYVFPTSGYIALPRLPRMKDNLQGHTYFSLGELTSRRKIVRRLTEQGR